MGGMSLFSDLPSHENTAGKIITEVDKSTVDPVEKKVTRLWGHWVGLTGRERNSDGSVPERFRKAVRKALVQKGTAYSILHTRIDLATYIPPDDDSDLNRVIFLINGNRKYVDLARSRQKSDGIRYGFGERPLLMDMNDLCRMLCVDVALLAQREAEHALTIACKYTVEKADAKITDMRARFSLSADESILPSEFINNRINVRKRRNHKNSDDVGYDSGRKEQAQVPETVWLDHDADMLLMNGVAADKISVFHHDVPEGFWDKVLVQVTQNKKPVPVAVGMMERELDYSLKERTVG